MADGTPAPAFNADSHCRGVVGRSSAGIRAGTSRTLLLQKRLHGQHSWSIFISLSAPSSYHDAAGMDHPPLGTSVRKAPRLTASSQQAGVQLCDMCNSWATRRHACTARYWTASDESPAGPRPRPMEKAEPRLQRKLLRSHQRRCCGGNSLEAALGRGAPHRGGWLR